jgi:hypothetical protein
MWYSWREKHKFRLKNLKKIHHLGYLLIDERIILKWILDNICCEDVNLIDLVLIRVQLFSVNPGECRDITLKYVTTSKQLRRQR